MDNASKAAIALIAKRLIEDSSEDSDEELLFKETETHSTIEDYIGKTVKNYSPEVFKSHFRMSRGAVELLCSELDFKTEFTCGWRPISPLHQVLMTLWTLDRIKDDL
ncbi:uncharacterized protein LOC111692278 [Anoplophora glabripennis]|uniref:uncharacterized protein LOC111692278 n=1 Tax=Anoplophora glabripennis TaxID=217634 RepID=UPI000C783559|nr:uncharacterized protein LOC111692278 [Anoplophora glabripennis]